MRSKQIASRFYNPFCVSHFIPCIQVDQFLPSSVPFSIDPIPTQSFFSSYTSVIILILTSRNLINLIKVRVFRLNSLHRLLLSCGSRDRWILILVLVAFVFQVIGLGVAGCRLALLDGAFSFRCGLGSSLALFRGGWSFYFIRLLVL